MKEILDDELTTTPAKKEERTAFCVTYEEFSEMYDKNNGFDVKEPDNIEKVSDDFNSFLISAAEGYSKTILDQRKEEVISLLAQDNLLTPEIKERILACTTVYEINDIFKLAIEQSDNTSGTSRSRKE